MTEPTTADIRKLTTEHRLLNLCVAEIIVEIHDFEDRLEAAEEKLAWGVSLPKITKKLHDEFGNTCLMDVNGWSQIAVDFAGVLNSTLISEEKTMADITKLAELLGPEE